MQGNEFMRSEAEIKREIDQIEYDNVHILTGSLASVPINAPRALQQISVESKLRALYWVIGRTYKSSLKGIDT